MFLRLCLAFLLPSMAMAATDPAAMCEQAAQIAAREEGVPFDVMRALTLTETGRRQDGALRPWAWAVNRAGEGQWFDTREQALAFAESSLRQGARNFDVGCFQLNHRWHGDAFRDLAAMFDPVTNARYAARYLREQFATTGDWTAAAGAYHSFTPEFAQRYSARFAQLRGGMADMPAPTQVAVHRENNFPLLRGGQGASGSLVPLSGGRKLFGP
ncbi:transglycosylase SLT domain-containing protein [Falsirhodobacter halotolerans]|uniref:transglycosylase SLT domain-containing protein n=1 Tax=Falsirhodobacter halotolerans TaxID=1146892 RepID=UPI001FD0D4D9|nr:transglycosylase SLT domain-containing protein [Falsirhodobacter halotolerans]MCJ8140552.1 transglycosylase SLT domain-containing protein [Falsirhodobacter halotolerans]